jgi:radical SAM superfamily enzyme YgiQ (UPF0313 family)
MNDIANTPLSSSLMTGYTAAALEEAGHQVAIVEGNLAGMALGEVVATAASTKPQLVGLHLVYDWSDGAQIASLLRDVREACGPVPVFLYGFYPTFAWPELLDRHPEVTAVIIGEPELTVVEVAAATAARVGARGAAAGPPSFARAVEASLAATPGLAVRGADGAAGLTASRPPIEDLDSLPHPRRTRELLRMREVNISGSRGCYGSCTFCTINPFYGGRSLWRPRSPESVIAEMAAVLEEHPDTNRFYFVDPNFFGPAGRGRARALTLARMIRERFDIRFGLEGRVNDIDEELVENLVAAGFDELLVGLESGSDATLRRLNKHTTVEQNRRALRILRSYGVEPNVGFIMFEPDSSLDDLRVNLAFLREERLLDRLAVTANVLYHQQILLRPTPAYRAALAAGQLVVSPHNPYEGTMPYLHPEVAFLAETMAEVCRHVFSGLPREVWVGDDTGGAARDHAAADRLAGLNRSLVGLFERLLDGLADGRLRPSAELATDVVSQARAWIEGIRRAA